MSGIRAVTTIKDVTIYMLGQEPIVLKRPITVLIAEWNEFWHQTEPQDDE